MTQPSFNLIHSKDTCEDLLVRANIHLSANRAREALDLYTQVIYETSPGNPCALLNRSLAYVILGYPELAVTDAYRAVTFIHDLNDYEASRETLLDDETPNGILIRTIATYLRAELLHVQIDAEWTLTQGYNWGWVGGAMAKVVLEVKTNAKTPSGIQWKSLEQIAMFRLCGSLWYCGGGALSDAIGTLSDLITANKSTKKRNSTKKQDEVIQLSALGDMIMEDIEEKLGNNPAALKATMKTKTTLVNRVVYPWNFHEYGEETFVQVQELQWYVDYIAKSCTIKPTPLTYMGEYRLGLVATKDIYPNDIVLMEKSLLQVTASREVTTLEELIDSPSLYCDTCAAMIVTPEKLRTKINELKLDHKSFSWIYPDTETLEADVRCCRHCNAVVYCSRECHSIARSIHGSLCNKTIESEIRSLYLPRSEKLPADDPTEYEDRNFVHPKKRCLYDLLFVRVLNLVNNNVGLHPLDLNEVRWMNGGLRSSDVLVEEYEDRVKFKVDGEIADSEMSGLSDSISTSGSEDLKLLPWTFRNNVVGPDRYIKQIGFDLRTNLKKLDGWVVNTLYAKIMESTQIYEGARQVKTYDDDGQLTSEEFPGSNKPDHDVLSGAIYPIFSAVSVANRFDGEHPNVGVENSSDIKCTARPCYGQACIRAGEPIRR